MLTTSVGLLTIVDINSASPGYHWRGAKLDNVISCTAINSPGLLRVSLRFPDPARVSPALPAAEQGRLTALYAELRAVGIVVLLAKGI